jgi:O-antigen chain-terminating methyltransferase
MSSPAPKPDIDRILGAIRTEARARGARGRVGTFEADAAAAPIAQLAHPGLPQPDIRHAADLLALPLDVFIEEAYRHLLGRPPDAAGAAYYQRALLRGRITRMEVAGRLAFSPEGRRRAGALGGIPAGFACAMLYRLPLVGPLAALLARLLRLPAHCQDRAPIEATALATGGWMKR